MTNAKQLNNEAVVTEEIKSQMPLEEVKGLVGTSEVTETKVEETPKVEETKQEAVEPTVVTKVEKPVKFAIGTQHTDANGVLEITKRYVENNVTMLEYFYVGKPETVIKNKEVNLHSNIYKFAQRVKNGQVGRKGHAEAVEALKSENEDLKTQIEELHKALAEAKEEAQKFQDLYEKNKQQTSNKKK